MDRRTNQQSVGSEWESGRDVQGPTFKQELFLHRQGLWSENLSLADAAWLVEERLKELHARRVETAS